MTPHGVPILYREDEVVKGALSIIAWKEKFFLSIPAGVDSSRVFTEFVTTTKTVVEEPVKPVLLYLDRKGL